MSFLGVLNDPTGSVKVKTNVAYFQTTMQNKEPMIFIAYYVTLVCLLINIVLIFEMVKVHNFFKGLGRLFL